MRSLLFHCLFWFVGATAGHAQAANWTVEGVHLSMSPDQILEELGRRGHWTNSPVPPPKGSAQSSARFKKHDGPRKYALEAYFDREDKNRLSYIHITGLNMEEAKAAYARQLGEPTCKRGECAWTGMDRDLEVALLVTRRGLWFGARKDLPRTPQAYLQRLGLKTPPAQPSPAAAQPAAPAASKDPPAVTAQTDPTPAASSAPGDQAEALEKHLEGLSETTRTASCSFIELSLANPIMTYAEQVGDQKIFVTKDGQRLMDLPKACQ